ncbi:MAG: hypothetical protein CM15mP77_0800 [Synechococcus sp.]|nr:MAG: hypothetical protein CM15mP77_0800 [Synechococcus sp.]
MARPNRLRIGRTLVTRHQKIPRPPRQGLFPGLSVVPAGFLVIHAFSQKAFSSRRSIPTIAARGAEGENQGATAPAQQDEQDLLSTSSFHCNPRMQIGSISSQLISRQRFSKDPSVGQRRTRTGRAAEIPQAVSAPAGRAGHELIHPISHTVTRRKSGSHRAPEASRS